MQEWRVSSREALDLYRWRCNQHASQHASQHANQHATHPRSPVQLAGAAGGSLREQHAAAAAAAEHARLEQENRAKIRVKARKHSLKHYVGYLQRKLSMVFPSVVEAFVFLNTNGDHAISETEMRRGLALLQVVYT